MKLTLESLHQDHDNLRRILYLLEQLLIDIYRGSTQGYPMLQRILAYIQDYPERVHHPAEDAMFSVIFNNGIGDREFRKKINAVVKDHSEIEAITRDTLKAVEDMLVSTHSDISVIGEKLSALISRQRAHLLFEEMNIYPRLAISLDSEGWRKVATLVPDYEDPIFGSKVTKEYELISKALSTNLADPSLIS